MVATVLEFQSFVTPETACHAAARSMSEAAGVALHSHDFHELFWVEQGEGYHLVNGQRRPLQPGTFVAVAASDVHGFAVDRGHTFRLVNVAFARETWRYLLERYPSARGDLMQRPLADREFRLSSSELAELALSAHELLSGRLDRRATERFLLNALYVADRVSSAEFPADTPRWLIEACVAIREKRRFVKGTQTFVKLCGHSAEHVARETRRWLDKTPTDLVNAARLDWASGRLAETDDPVLEVALECGYANLAHFYRLFRAQFRTSPAEYRRRQQQLLSPLPEQRASLSVPLSRARD
jgi:AraC family cel operon transcriptional repressor